MRTGILHIIFLFIIVGCTQPTIHSVQKVVEAQAKSLIDSGYIENGFIILYELSVNESNYIYEIADSKSPVCDVPLQLPSRIVRYKDKFICFIEQDEPEMNVNEVIEITGYSDNPIDESGYTLKWFLGISMDTHEKTLVKYVWEEDKDLLDETALWPYLSGYTKDCPVQMCVCSNNAKVNINPSGSINVDSVRKKTFDYVENLYGEMYLKNNTDSTICLSTDSYKHYAIIDNRDTLYLSLRDSLPLVLSPNERRIVWYDSKPNKRFFDKLSLKEDPWEYLYHLFGSSTYCLMKINQEEHRTRVMHFDTDKFELTDDNGKCLFHILRPGVYDKGERETRNVHYWWSPEE